MFVRLLSVIALIAACFATDYPKVPVETYYEALCPGCQQFITGSLTKVMAMPDIVDIINLKMVPYGNTKKNADGSFTCQHGTDECTSDVLEMCTMYKLAGNISVIGTGEKSKDAWPFMQCMEQNEGNPSKASSCYSKTMSSSGLAWSTVTDCQAKEAKDVQNAGADATPKHDYVPWVLVNGALLQNTNTLLYSICQAYTGPKPASCRFAEELSTGVCMNN